MPIALTLTDLTIVLVIEDMKAMVSIAQVHCILKGIKFLQIIIVGQSALESEQI